MKRPQPSLLYAVAFLAVALLLSGSDNILAQTAVPANEDRKDELWQRIRVAIGNKAYEEGLHTVDSAIALASGSEDLAWLARLYNAEGVLYKRKRNLKKALASYQLSLQYKRQLADTLEIAKTLQNIGNVYRQLNRSDSAIFYYERSLVLKTGRADQQSLANTRLNLGNYYFDLGQLDAAINQYKQVRTIAGQIDSQELLAKSLNNLGNAYQGKGYFGLSNDYYHGALQLYNELKLPEFAGNTLLNIAVGFVKLENYEEADTYFLKARALFEETGQAAPLQLIAVNRADIRLYESRPKEALDLLLPIFKATQQSDLESLYGNSCLGIGRSYMQMGSFDEAASYLQRAVNFYQNSQNLLMQGRSYNNLAIMYQLQGKYDKAVNTYQLARSIAEELGALDLLTEAIEGISEAYELNKQQDSALVYSRRYQLLKDSLFDGLKTQQVFELKEKYEATEKEEKISLLEMEYRLSQLENERNTALLSSERSKRRLYLVGGAGLLIVLCGFFIYYRQRLTISNIRAEEARQQHDKAINELISSQEMQTLEAMVAGKDSERKRIATELHDHFGSLLATVKMNLNAAKQSPAMVEQANELVSQACDDIRQLAHQLNLGISHDFGLLAALEQLALTLSQSGRVQVSFTENMCEELLYPELEIPLYRMVQELVSNVLKHANASQLSIQLTCFQELVSVIVTDDGDGFDVTLAEAKSEGMGIGSLYNRVGELDGEMKIDSSPGNGTTVLIDIPVKDQ